MSEKNKHDIIYPHHFVFVFQAPKMIQSQPRNLSWRCTRTRTKTKTKPSTLTSPVPRTRRTSGWSSPPSKTPSWDTTSKSSTWFNTSRVSAHFIFTLFWELSNGLGSWKQALMHHYKSQPSLGRGLHRQQMLPSCSSCK